MATTYSIHPGTETTMAHEHHAIHSTQTPLRVAYGLFPIVAGFDKFTNLVTHWDQYLNPMVLNLIPLTAGAFMRVVGVIEIVAGVLLLTKPRVGAPVVALWLLAIAGQLLVGWSYLDIAVRDIWLAIGAIALWRLSRVEDLQHATD